MPRGSKVGSKHWEERQRDNDLYCEARAFQKEKQKELMMETIGQISTKHARNNALMLLTERAVLAEALDPLLALEGLKKGFWLKIMHRVIYSGCIEPVLIYLRNIKRCWDIIRDGESLRPEDVRALENKCPRLSRGDSREIQRLINSRSIFPHSSDEWRASLLKRLHTIETLIPSLTTFFDDFKLIEKCKDCFNHIVAKKKNKSIKQRLETIFKHRESGAELDKPYRLLWLYVVQNWMQMKSPSDKSADKLLANESECFPDELRLQLFAVRASGLGFESTQITKLLHTAAEKTSALNCLFRLRSPKGYEFQSSDISLVQDTIFDVCQRAKKVTAPTGKPCLVGQIAPRFLSGFPDVASYENDRVYFDDETNIYDEEFTQREQPVQGEAVTSFFRLKSFCLLWFKDETPPPPIQRPRLGFGSPTDDSSEAFSMYTTDEVESISDNDRRYQEPHMSEQEYRESISDGDEITRASLGLPHENIPERDDSPDMMPGNPASPTQFIPSESSAPPGLTHENRTERDHIPQTQPIISGPVIFQRLLDDGRWSTVLEIEADVEEAIMKKDIRALYACYSSPGLAYVESMLSERRLFFVLPEDCYSLIHRTNREKIRKFIVTNEPFNSWTLINASL